MFSVNIPKGSINLAGLLYEPTVSPGVKAPGIVVIHPGGGVKEQTANTYAARLSKQGYVTICYDASHQGDSGGLPHFLEDPNTRVSDVSAVVDYLQTLDDMVDASRIAVVGIESGGGYAVAAAKGDHRIKAVAIVSAVNIGDAARLGWFGSEHPSDKVAGLEQAAQAIQAEVEAGNSGGGGGGGDGTPMSAPYVPPALDDAMPRDLRESHDYYLTPRGRHRNAQNKMLLRSVPLVMNFDAWHFADLFLSQPLLVIVGGKAESRWHSEKLCQLLLGGKRKKENLKTIVVPEARHIDFYDRDEFVDPAIEDIVKYFGDHLTA
ncbi:X-Pro dipeptidyl-peptidase protein [Xylariaceae sp. FL1651]|nr:X-Pro dipeptidyl-peptidase protein [Xylariaceae sp. FL1651]